jgi:hypothetical protein
MRRAESETQAVVVHGSNDVQVIQTGDRFGRPRATETASAVSSAVRHRFGQLRWPATLRGGRMALDSVPRGFAPNPKTGSRRAHEFG